MSEENNLENTIAQDIEALKKQFDQIKSETETFLVSAKSLSDKGATEAHDLLSAAKSNWQSIVASFEASSIAKFFSKGKKPTAKKAKAKVKAVVKSAAKKIAKKTAKKVTKPAAKKAAPKKATAKKKK